MSPSLMPAFSFLFGQRTESGLKSWCLFFMVIKVNEQHSPRVVSLLEILVDRWFLAQIAAFPEWYRMH